MSSIPKYSVEEFVKKFSFEDCVLELLKKIGADNEQIKDIIIHKYQGNEIPSTGEELLLNYFINNSVFSAATMANPATSIVTELLYERPDLTFPIDKYFLSSKSGRAIHSRIFSVEKNLHELIEKYIKINKEILIGNIGGGPSRDIVDVFFKYYKNNNNIKAISIDRDKFTTKRGKLLADIAGVSDKIDYIEGNFMKYRPKKKINIILLIGVLCSLPPKTCILILKKIKKMFAKGGCIIASNVSLKMLDDDPFTYFIMENILNWKLTFKSEETLKEIFKKSGLKWQGNFIDEYGFHNMGIGL